MSEIIQIPNSIWIITQDSSPAPIATDEIQKERTQRSAVSAQIMQQNMSQFLLVIGDVFIQAEQQAFQMQQASGTEAQKPPLQLDQVELFITIDGEGAVSLCGDDRDRGAVKLTFKRNQNTPKNRG